MPFQSKAQKGWMFANKPEMAHEWAGETPDMAHLPEHKKKKKKSVKDALVERLKS